MLDHKSQPLFSEKDIDANFPEQYVSRGRRYQQQGRVKKLSAHLEDDFIKGIVKGRETYHVSINFDHDHDSVDIDGECTCPIGFNCKHVIAVLFAFLQQNNKPKVQRNKMDELWDDWFINLNQIINPPELAKPDNIYANQIFYILDNKFDKSHLLIKVVVAKKLKKGGIGKPKAFSTTADTHYAAKVTEDEEIIDHLEFINYQSYGYYSKACYPLHGTGTKELLTAILKTGRCYWQDLSGQPIKFSEAKRGEFIWKMKDNGWQHLECRVDGETLEVLQTTPLWYFNIKKNECGLLNINIPDKVALHLLRSPDLPPEQAKQISVAFNNKIAKTKIPSPRTFSKPIIEKKPLQALLKIYADKFNTLNYFLPHELRGQLALAELSFNYGEHNVMVSDPARNLNSINKDKLIQIPRDINAEGIWIATLIEADLLPLKSFPLDFKQKDQYDSDFLIAAFADDFIIENFINKSVPKLKQKGMLIEFADDFPFKPTLAIDDWYMDIDENSSYDWFNLELGITIKNEKFNLLPILVDLINKHSPLIGQTKGQASDLNMTMPDGTHISIPGKRLKKILTILTELYDKPDFNDTAQIKLPNFRAADVLSLEKDLENIQTQWKIKDSKIKAFAKQLVNSKGFKKIPTPKNFQATLRPYQQHGLNWMQFLRENTLGGILADDMGLGKTIQALAHLATEKAKRRLKLPTLIIAPTSLMTNWQMEANRFAPKLKVLVLHGDKRAENYDTIQRHDIILTTYPLVLRDKKIILNNQFYYLILDEAQFIKNAKSKTYKIIQQIQAQHRLCLTGTPVENNYGELWALFNVILPGFLGNDRQFKQWFRTPIEKHQSQEHLQALSRRIAPFMLRRSKDEVMKELPKKTTIIRNIELTGEQRDLYETIRLSMEKKVRQALSEKGLARSHIVVLDALLKLRQACCDPRIVKVNKKPKKINSNKLDLLMEIVEELLEEKRCMLIFSSFTSMLALIEDELVKRKMNYVKLTGQTKNRKEPIEAFQSGRVPIFLISLKAGGTGLNLTAADIVIHYDPWWNPAAENQATDRAHRIGQDKPVFVYKLITTDTVEEKILQMQENKSALLSGIFSKSKATKTGQFSADDVKYLLSPLSEEVG